MTFDKPQETPKNNAKLELMKTLENLNLPNSIIVTSASAIKVETVKKVFKTLFPDREFDVVGVKTKSGVNEQPVGEETELGANNRIADAENIVGLNEVPHAFVSIENGIFKISNNRYEDKAVVTIKLPNGQTFSETSTRGVEFPEEVVQATLQKEGGFAKNTVGSTIAEEFAGKGVTINKQDPHSALTNGEFSREDQIISTLEEVLKKAAAKQI